MPVLYLLTGVTAGVLSGLFGIGGGIIIVASFTSFAGMTQRMANGTSLATLLLPVSLLAVLEYWRDGNVNFAAAAWAIPGLIAGAWLGARYAQSISNQALQRAFAILLVLIAVRLWFRHTT